MGNIRITLILCSVIQLCIFPILSASPQSAFSASAAETGSIPPASTIRGIQRLLWALDYGSTEFDGIDTADMRDQASRFLSNRGKALSLPDDQLLLELKKAFEEKRKTARDLASSTTEIVDRALTKSRLGFKVSVSVQDDLLLAGSSNFINRFRLKSSTPLRPYTDGAAIGSFGYSQPLGLIVEIGPRKPGLSSPEGLLILDAESGLKTDFIKIPDGVVNLLGSKMEISPNGMEVIVLTHTNVWLISLQTKVVSKLGGELPSVVLGDVKFSPDGHFVATSWAVAVSDSKFTKTLVVWDLVSKKRTSEFTAEAGVFSFDGRLIALAVSNQFEIRETQTGRLTAASKKFELPRPDFRHSASIAFDSGGSNLLYLVGSSLYEWNLGTGKNRERFKIPFEIDGNVIDATNGKLFAISSGNISTYDLESGANLGNTDEKLKPLNVISSVISPNKKLAALQTSNSIFLVDTATGSVRKTPTSGLSNISAIAFMPDSERLLTASESGVAILDLKDGRLQTIGKLSNEPINVLVVAKARPLAAAVVKGKDSNNQLVVFDLANGVILARSQCDGIDDFAFPSSITRNNVAFVDGDRRLLFPGDGNKIVLLDIPSGKHVFERELRLYQKKEKDRTTWQKGTIGYVISKGAGLSGYWVSAASLNSTNVLYEYIDGKLGLVLGTETGQSFFPVAGARIASIAEDGAIDYIFLDKPTTEKVDGSNFKSELLVLRDRGLVIESLPQSRIITVDKSGEVRIYARGQTMPSLRTLVYEGGDWLSRTDAGFFAGTRKASQNLLIASGADRSFPIDNVFNALYRPDLVAEAAIGDPDGKVKVAAAKLDLNKVMASGSAPKIAIRTPTAGTSSATDEVAVEATVSDQGGGIGKVEWRINGVTSGIETRGLERVEAAASAGRSLTVRRTLALERSENRIEVLAYNNKDLIASEPVSVTVKWDGEKTATPPKLFVMAVGVNDYYDSRLRLSYAVPDATAIAEGFRKAGTGLYAGVDVTTVLDKDVTIANLDKVFTELGKKAQPRDVFVFFLAGHGKTKNGRYYFLPRDFRYEDEDSIEKAGMDQDKFQAWFARIPARKSILLYDTCESGSLTGTKARGSDIDERLGALNRMTRATGRTFLTATTDDAPALEGYHGHGVFTYALLDALDHADVNKNGLIEVSELADYIDQKVPDFSFEAFKLRQIPQRNIVGNNFALTNKAEVLSTAAAGRSGSQPANGSNGGLPRPVPTTTTNPNSASAAIAIPIKPTHVVIAPTDVKAAIGEGSTTVIQLPPGTQVELIKTENSWALIARNGQNIGYVQQRALAGLQ